MQNQHTLKMCMYKHMFLKCLFQEPLFAARVVYDLLFYFIVIIIVLNLIFGVIIDTFADLRSEKQKKEEILKTTCFICGKCPQDSKIIKEETAWEEGGARMTFCHALGKIISK